MKILTAEKMRQLEEAAVAGGLDYRRLMENAGSAAARVIRSRYEVQGKSVTVLCGSGNNGGDGFVIARKLTEEGAQVTAVLTGEPPRTPQAREMLSRISPSVLDPVSLASDPFDANSAARQADLIVDAVYGIGFHGRLPDAVRALFRVLNTLPVPKVAVDVPSGLNCDTGEADEDTLSADITVTFSALKPGLFSGAQTALCGQVEVVSIGIDQALLDQFSSEQTLIDEGMVRGCFSPRAADSHKGTYGRLLMVCGSYGMAGAAMMAAEAALRCGVGLAALALPRSLYPIAAARLCEPVFLPLPETDEGGISLAARPLLRRETEKADALLIGCGLGGGDEIRDVVSDLLAHAHCPVILDADGINAFVGHIDRLKTACPLILTPHPGEMARLMNTSADEVQKNRMEYARRLSEEIGAVIVLKGHRTIVAAPGQEPLVNVTGNPGMATGGSGDVLAGMIASFAAQGMSPDRAAMCGVYLHGRAGDAAAARLSQHAMLPTDLIRELGGLFSNLE